jgi:hypothetical protein
MPLTIARNQIAFPAGASNRFYLPQLIAFTTNTATRYTITYIPYVIKKATSSLQLCYEQTAIGSQTIIAGIYDGSNGLASAPLIFSGTINTSGIGIFTTLSSLFFKSGYYIVAGIATSATPIAGKAFSTNAFPSESFGRPSSDTSISISTFYTQTGLTDLPSTIGTITMNASNVSPNIFLQY